MRLFIPGQGMVDSRVYTINSLLKDYDSRLMFSKHPETGDWCVFIEMPRPEQPYPVMGFGDNIPEASMVLDRIKQGDTMRTGNTIYRDIVRSQERFRAAQTYKTDQAGEESAEVIEHFMRKEGKSPIIKSLPKGVSNNDS